DVCSSDLALADHGTGLAFEFEIRAAGLVHVGLALGETAATTAALAIAGTALGFSAGLAFDAGRVGLAVAAGHGVRGLQASGFREFGAHATNQLHGDLANLGEHRVRAVGPLLESDFDG